jgi:CO dehydrogenase maturation factor
MEHLSRRTTRQITKLVVLSDFTLIGIRSAKRIFELVEELSLEVKEKYFVVNKVKGELKELAPGFKETRLTPAAYFPYDEKLEEFSTTALPLTSYQGKVREEVKKWLKIAKVI